jgi:hypothetical protein
MLAIIDNCGQGMNADLTPEELGNGVWTQASNIRFNNGYAERFKGSVQVFSTPLVTPYFISPYVTSTSRFWIYAGLAKVYVDDGTTRTDITGTPPTGGIDDRWTGGSINGVFILNNGVDVPMYWAGTGTLATIGGWNATWRAAALRPFKNYMVALGITKGANKYPNMVKWCTTLNPGAITAAGDWDETNPALDAGEQDLAETSDILVDCIPLGDTLIIYKERSMYAMSYIGAPYIFRFQRLPGESGMLARGCAVNTPYGHVVLTAGDVVLNTGQGANSIANGMVRKYIFDNIDSTNYKRAFVTANPQKNEVWVCFPYGTSQVCNKACVWNWIDKTWAIRELTNVTYGAFGQINYTAVSSTWADTGTWDTDGSGWNENEYSPAEARLVMGHTTPLISLVDTGTTEFGALIAASAERTGMNLGDGNSVKLVKAIWPHIDGNNGASVSIQVGASMYPDSAPTWGAAQTFTVGQSAKVDCFASGRYLAVRFINTTYSGWRMKSFGIEYEPAGAY